MANEIKSIRAREILDSRGNPTIEVDCVTEKGTYTASVPSGASTGSKEAFELRDGGDRYGGKGVLKAIKSVKEIIALKLAGMDVTKQKEIDEALIALDGTSGKYNLGGNAIAGASMAVCKAGAAAKEMDLYEYIAELFGNKEVKLPKLCFNVINGGAHADNHLDFQEFMVVPQFETVRENLQAGSEIYYKLKKFLKEAYPDFPMNVGDEGGFAPPIETPEVALGFLVKAIDDAEYYGGKAKIIMDIASTQFYKIEKGASEGFYGIKEGVLSRSELLNYYIDLARNYPVIGLEDPFSEEDWKGFEKITERLGNETMIIGDDLLVSSPDLIKEGRMRKAANAVILKINQVGTVTEILESAKLAKEAGWKTVVSHRSGETCDSFIADLAAGISSDYIKSGAPARGERLAKYNRLCRIEDKIKNI
ncbi:MAG: phosphopyruvate hydratase [Candidatus Pacebacteria bacterium]|nr:phosphopyruvate hydratase [Candidatus Paceibacterota bacterium]